MKDYAVTVRLNVETSIASSREVEITVRQVLADTFPEIEVASVTAYEDVLIQERAA